MFASEQRRKIFVGIMIFSWAVVFLSWICLEGYYMVSAFYPHLIIIMALLLFLCHSKPQRKMLKIALPILTEVLLVSIPVLSFGVLMLFLYMFVRYESISFSGSAPSLLHWIFLAIAWVPVVAFPILRWWKREEVQ